MNGRAASYIKSLQESGKRPEADRLIPQGHEYYPTALLAVGLANDVLRMRAEIKRKADILRGGRMVSGLEGAEWLEALL